MVCSITSPGHSTNLTGVKVGLALLRDPFRTPVAAEVARVDGERITLRLPSGTLEARCHDAARLGALLDAAVSARGVAAENVSQRSSTGALAAFNLALPSSGSPTAGRVTSALFPGHLPSTPVNDLEARVKERSVRCSAILAMRESMKPFGSFTSIALRVTTGQSCFGGT
jgi:hypothetical protein